MENIIPQYHLNQSYLIMFRKTPRNKIFKAINSLKSIIGIAETRQVVDFISKLYPSLHDDIEGNLYPDSPKAMSKSPSSFYRPISVISEINWAFAYFRDHWENIVWFINKKNYFEDSFLLGNFNECESILNDIRQRLGVSLWYFEAMSLLYEYRDGQSKSMEYISSVLEQCQDNSNYIPSLIYNIYERCAKGMSPYKFDEDLNALYKRNRTDLHEDYYKYILYRLNYYNQYDKVDLALPVMFESLSSLVDRYLIILSVIKAGTVSELGDLKIRSRAYYLYNKTHDESLIPLLFFSGKTPPPLYYSKEYVSVFDSYYAGDFYECKNASKALIASNPSLFEAYVMYCQALINLKEEYSCPIPISKNAPANDICRLIYCVLTFENEKQSLYSLYQINKNLYSFRIAAGLDYFVKTESNEPVNAKVYLLSIYRFDPRFTKVFDNIDDALDYLSSYDKCGVSSLACDVWKRMIKHETVYDLNIDTTIALPINADHYFVNSKYGEAYKIYETLYSVADSIISLRQKAISRMVDCLFLQGYVMSAISLYVKKYLYDYPSVAKVDTKTIIKHLQDNLYEGFRRTVDFVIFVGLTCDSTVDKSFILLEYCEIQNVSKPSELIGLLDIEDIGVEKIELFYTIINDDETLRHYLNIDSYKDRLTERRKILLYLISLNTQKKDDYQVALKKIDDALLVYNLSKNMDESKIYANDNAIINYRLSEIDGLYNRYRLLVDTVIDKRKNIYVVNLCNSSLFDDNADYETDVNSNVAIKTNGLYEVFLNLFKNIREQFLYSDYGLVAYLSTRVRHGELETMLRPEMAKRKLILSTRDNEYQTDLYWTSNYNLTPEECNSLNDALVCFSRSFDTTVTSLIKQRLQIYDRIERPEGLFNYEVDEDQLAFKAMEIGLLLKDGKDDKNTFCRLIIKWLWEITEESLSTIREYIETTTTTSIMHAIDKLESDIKDKQPDGYAKNALLENIREAREAMTIKLQKVSKWFTVSQSKVEDVDFKAVSHLVYDSVRYSHTNRITDSQPIIKGETFNIKSEFVIHYADILRNIVCNMFEHGSESNDGKLHFELIFDISDSDVQFHFINDTDKDPDTLNTTFRQKLSTDEYVFGEGGSGIAKVKKILKRDLRNCDNSIEMRAEQGKCYTEVIIYINGFKA